MNERDPKKADINYGIQADTVNADALAVGHGASASTTIVTNSRDTQAELLSAIAALRIEIANTVQDVGARAAIEADLGSIEDCSKKPQIQVDKVDGALQSIASKLGAVGVVLEKAGAIVDPLKRIGTLLGLSLKFLGL